MRRNYIRITTKTTKWKKLSNEQWMISLLTVLHMHWVCACVCTLQWPCIWRIITRTVPIWPFPHAFFALFHSFLFHSLPARLFLFLNRIRNNRFVGCARLIICVDSSLVRVRVYVFSVGVIFFGHIFHRFNGVTVMLSNAFQLIRLIQLIHDTANTVNKQHTYLQQSCSTNGRQSKIGKRYSACQQAIAHSQAHTSTRVIHACSVHLVRVSARTLLKLIMMMKFVISFTFADHYAISDHMHHLQFEHFNASSTRTHSRTKHSAQN